MKINSLIFCLLLFSICIKAQKLKIWVFDSTGRSIYPLEIGFLPNATIGLDTSIGENNLSNTPFASTELGRVMQRDSAHYLCSHYFNGFSTKNIYHPVNFDSRFNFRNRADSSIENRTFEIKLAPKTNYIKLFADAPIASFVDKTTLAVNNFCLSSPEIISYEFGSNSLGIRTEANDHNYIGTLIITFKKQFTIETKDVLGLNPHVYPEPFSDFVNIDNLNGIKGNILVFNFLGNLITTQKIDNLNSTIVNLSTCPNGIYFMQIVNEQKQIVSQKKLIKSN